MRRFWIGMAALFALSGAAMAQTPPQATAIFAGGCFWCTEADFDKVPGVVSTTSGFVGGKVANPTYRQVSAGGTGYTEAVQVVYDPSKVSYDKLLDVFWHNHDMFAANRQFCDVGAQYRPGIFYLTEDQHRVAEASKAALQQRFPIKIVTEITPATTFYPAEDYHQDYHTKNPVRYKFYRWNCGRDQRLEEIWGHDGKGHS